MQSEPLILAVEDEHDLLELLSYNLAREGYRVLTAATGEEAVRLAQSELPDLVLLDLMLPGMAGMEVCRVLKARPRTAGIPIVMLTAKGEEADIVRGLEAGADDYITKPFSARVLLARIKAALRSGTAPFSRGAQRSASAGNHGRDAIVQAGPIALDAERHEVTADGQRIDLTVTEFRLLRTLAGRPGRVFTRQQLVETIHDGLAAVTGRSIDVQVVALRKKLGDAGDWIETVRGVGYRFREK